MKKKEYGYTLNRLLQNDKITDAYLSGSENVEWDKYDLEPVKNSEKVNLRGLEAKINGIRSRTVKAKASPASSDGEISVEVHKALPLTKREACDARIWNFMNCIFGREYVAWRWQIDKQDNELTTGKRNRFIGNRRRSTFARLWWIAELTEDIGYEYTKQLLSVQDLAVSLYERSSYAPLSNILRAYLDTIFDGQKMKISEATNRELAKELRKAGATVVLDALDYEEAKDLIHRLLEKAEME
jgi:hypothetical protein